MKTHCPQGHAYVEGSFYLNGKGSRHCKACHKISVLRNRKSREGVATARWGHIRRNYGLEKYEYRRILAYQEKKCANPLCNEVAENLCVDHDHACCPGVKSCGQCIRGLLCKTCNKILGLAKIAKIFY